DITTNEHMEPGETGASRLPLWFIEGMAEYLSLGAFDPTPAMWLPDAARKEQLPAVKDLDDPRYFPYRWGQAFWAYVAGRWGDAVVETVFAEAVRLGNAQDAFETITGVAPKDLSAQWHEAIRAQYGPILRAASPASVVGRLA